jgi:hypothetical protein
MSVRVLIVGGAGAFGRRLAEGLVATTDAHVVIAGRSLQRAEEAAAALGAAAAALDRDKADPVAIAALNPDIVVDAAGPFQGANLRFAQACIEAGTHYFDLADARDFVAAFPKLDQQAKARRVAAITGASSTPAITHAVLDELCDGWRRVDCVYAAIAPGNRAPRGASVVKAILTWAGAPVRVFKQGAWRSQSGWSHCRSMDIEGLGRRRLALAETPDLDLVPQRFAVRDTALFMAGLELPLLHRGVETVGALRGVWRHPERAAELFRRVSELLLPFGSDKGAMVVEVQGRDRTDQPTRALWTMIAPSGLGPYTPTLPALALLRRFIAGAALAPGAYPCVGLLKLEEIEREFARLGLTTSMRTDALVAPFEAALGARFAHAPAAVRAAHRAGPVARFVGAADIAPAASSLARFCARLFGLPAGGASIPVSVTKRLDAVGETWERNFGGRIMRSRLSVVRPGVVEERFGPFRFDLALDVKDGALTMRVIGWRLGPLPLPRALAPRSDAAERQDDSGRFRFDVPIAVPLLGRLTHYSGALTAEEVEVRPLRPVSAPP